MATKVKIYAAGTRKNKAGETVAARKVINRNTNGGATITEALDAVTTAVKGLPEGTEIVKVTIESVSAGDSGLGIKLPKAADEKKAAAKSSKK